MCKTVSILVPVLNEVRFIGNVLNDISKQSYPLNFIEVLIIDGGSTDGTKEWINKNINKYYFKIELLDNPFKYQSYALNIGLKKASGEIIVRMDAHSSYEKDYIKKLVKNLENTDVINVGGPQVAKGYDFWSDIISNALSSPIGVGGAKFRYTSKNTETDSVFLGAWRKEDLMKIGGWNEDWIINEDTELNLRLKAQLKGKIITDPDIKVFYYSRNSLSKLAKQYYKFGFWRIKTFNIYPSSMRISHLVIIVGMPIIILSFISLMIAFVNINHILFLSGLFSLFYFLILTVYSFYIGIKKFNFNIIKIICLFITLITLHISWFFGSMAGIRRFGLPFKAIKSTICKILNFNDK